MHFFIVGFELLDAELFLIGLTDDIPHEFLLLFVLRGEKGKIVS